ncbi:MAG: iron-containing redox enzyme family protein [Pseudobdellovibrio sp.]
MGISKKLQASVKVTEALVLSSPWEEKEFYGWWLSQTYHFVSHTSRFLSLAAGCCSLDESDLHSFFIKHIPEETGHEKICLTDLKNLKLSISDEADTTKKFHLLQRQKILTESVVNHLGYMLFLENLSIAVGPKLLSILQRNYPNHGLKFLKLHTEEDISHVAKAIAFVDKLTSEQKSIVAHSIFETCDGYNKIILEGNKLFKKNKPAKLAA